MLCCEQLETRLTPAIFLAGSTVVIVGTEAPDTVYVFQNGPNIQFSRVGGGTYEQLVVPAASVGQVIADLGGGGDMYLNLGAANLAELVIGGAGDDYLQAGHGAATLLGGDGDDYLTSGSEAGPRQFFDGGAGRDLIFCSLGDDTVIGFNPAEDKVFNFGASGNDLFA